MLVKLTPGQRLALSTRFMSEMAMLGRGKYKLQTFRPNERKQVSLLWAVKMQMTKLYFLF